MPSWRKPFSRRDADRGVVAVEGEDEDEPEVSDGSLRYVQVDRAGNGSGATYQEATGAPVEVNSPLGYDVGPVTIVFLNVSMMIGTGVYSTREQKIPGLPLSIPASGGRTTDSPRTSVIADNNNRQRLPSSSTWAASA